MPSNLKQQIVASRTAFCPQIASWKRAGPTKPRINPSTSISTVLGLMKSWNGLKQKTPKIVQPLLLTMGQKFIWEVPSQLTGVTKPRRRRAAWFCTNVTEEKPKDSCQAAVVAFCHFLLLVNYFKITFSSALPQVSFAVDRSQSLFYFVPQEKGLIRRPC